MAAAARALRPAPRARAQPCGRAEPRRRPDRGRRAPGSPGCARGPPARELSPIPRRPGRPAAAARPLRGGGAGLRRRDRPHRPHRRAGVPAAPSPRTPPCLSEVPRRIPRTALSLRCARKRPLLARHEDPGADVLVVAWVESLPVLREVPPAGPGPERAAAGPPAEGPPGGSLL